MTPVDVGSELRLGEKNASSGAAIAENASEIRISIDSPIADVYDPTLLVMLGIDVAPVGTENWQTAVSVLWDGADALAVRNAAIARANALSTLIAEMEQRGEDTSDLRAHLREPESEPPMPLARISGADVADLRARGYVVRGWGRPLTEAARALAAQLAVR